ncbi:glycosyltransferase family 2 protein [Rhizobium tumorigenes]|uniref:glycosyltransferase family 2 protein n=1 Tax=Rhizobium tumorigenes TaxID=2041385 RepID=UPI00241F86B5|nr:glycosyltransferase [Rhizobium tumorigenes]WFS03315.1 glycosyltransferase [Rhizobium tumorigenes]
MQPYRLAIVISCWNYERYIAKAIESVVAQRRSDCELVVVDDGSSDKSWEIIQGLRVKAFRLPNGGQLAACLYGFEQTSAPFVLFLDADDELGPGSLAKIIGELDEDVAKLQFSMDRIDGEGKLIAEAVPLQKFRCRQELVDKVLKNAVYVTPPTSGNVFRRDVCELLREVDYDRATDGIILFVAPFFGDVVSLSETLGHYRIHDRNDSGIGRSLDAASLYRELRRFVDRTAHLSQVLGRLNYPRQLVRPEDTYFYHERSFYYAVATGRRPAFFELAKLLYSLINADFGWKPKSGLAAFFILTTVLPNKRAREGLAYRLEAGKRSLLGLLLSIL